MDIFMNYKVVVIDAIIQQISIAMTRILELSYQKHKRVNACNIVENMFIITNLIRLLCQYLSTATNMKENYIKNIFYL